MPVSRHFRPWKVAALSLAFTYLFFFEYLPPFRRVLIPFDLQSYHYPQLDNAFQALRHGSFPEWDQTLYGGQSFVGNINAALFYPPTWLMFAANLGRPSLSYQSLEDLVLAHVWVAFFLSYLWLRNKKLAELAAILGAAVFAYSGYLLEQLQHLGLVAGYAWMPLGLWGIDEAIEQQRWQPLWKTMAASTLCLLAGYPPTWFVFAVCMVSYAACRWKVALGVVLAIAASLVIAAVQVLPAYEATAMKAFDPRYGFNVRDPEFYISYLLPNYFDFGMLTSQAAWKGNYLYLGAPAFLGLVALVRGRKWRDLIPSLTVLVVSLIVAINPFDSVSAIVLRSSLLAQLCRNWYFLAGVTLAVAPLTAYGIDYCLSRFRRPVARWCVVVTCLLLTAWSATPDAGLVPGRFGLLHRREVCHRAGDYSRPVLARHFHSAVATWRCPGMAGGSSAAVGWDRLQSFGTSRWVNAGLRPMCWQHPLVSSYGRCSFSRNCAPRRIPHRRGSDRYLSRRCFNITVSAHRRDLTPFQTKQYKNLMSRIEHVRPTSNWEIDIDPANEAALNLLGVRYFITAGDRALYQQLVANPHFRRLEPSQTFYKVFEFVNARPPYGWESNSAERGARSAERGARSAERRAQSAERRAQSAERRARSAERGAQSAERRARPMDAGIARISGSLGNRRAFHAVRTVLPGLAGDGGREASAYRAVERSIPGRRRAAGRAFRRIPFHSAGLRVGRGRESLRDFSLLPSSCATASEQDIIP